MNPSRKSNATGLDSDDHLARCQAGLPAASRLQPLLDASREALVTGARGREL